MYVADTMQKKIQRKSINRERKACLCNQELSSNSSFFRHKKSNWMKLRQAGFPPLSNYFRFLQYSKPWTTSLDWTTNPGFYTQNVIRQKVCGLPLSPWRRECGRKTRSPFIVHEINYYHRLVLLSVCGLPQVFSMNIPLHYKQGIPRWPRWSHYLLLHPLRFL